MNPGVWQRSQVKHLVLAIVIALTGSCLAVAESGDAGIQMKQTIPLPGVEGRIDHFDFDTAGELFAQQKQPDNGEGYTSKPLPGWGFLKKQNSGDGHDRRATREDTRHGRERTALLKQ